VFGKELFNSVFISWIGSLHHKGRYVTRQSVCIARLAQM